MTVIALTTGTKILIRRTTVRFLHQTIRKFLHSLLFSAFSREKMRFEDTILMLRCWQSQTKTKPSQRLLSIPRPGPGLRRGNAQYDTFLFLTNQCWQGHSGAQCWRDAAPGEVGNHWEVSKEQTSLPEICNHWRQSYLFIKYIDNSVPFF